MNYVLHLTNACNLNCKYCYQNKNNRELDFENITAIIDREIANKAESVGLTFYGGEPLLKKDIIYKIMQYIEDKKSKTKFYFGITTNGTLLDDEFLDCVKQHMFVNFAYSFDGDKDSHDLNRITVTNQGSFDVVEANAKKLLKVYPEAVAMAVMTKNNIKDLDKNVEYLLSIGFKKINLQFDFLQDWQDEDLPIIEEEYNKVAEIYYNKILNEEDIDIIMFDEKIKTYVDTKYNCNDDCKLGLTTINVGADGNFYPCVQFVENPKYIIGNCKNGIDNSARANIIANSKKENEICKTCSVRTRCKHTCPCKNHMASGDMNTLSPIVCELERIIITISDKLAEKLYDKRSKLFIQKFYNENYSIFKQLLMKKGDK